MVNGINHENLVSLRHLSGLPTRRKPIYRYFFESAVARGAAAHASAVRRKRDLGIGRIGVAILAPHRFPLNWIAAQNVSGSKSTARPRRRPRNTLFHLRKPNRRSRGACARTGKEVWRHRYTPGAHFQQGIARGNCPCRRRPSVQAGARPADIVTHYFSYAGSRKKA